MRREGTSFKAGGTEAGRLCRLAFWHLKLKNLRAEFQPDISRHPDMPYSSREEDEIYLL